MRKKATPKTRATRPVVTATVTAPEPKAPAAPPTHDDKMAAFKLIEPDVMQAMDMAANLGRTTGRLEGYLRGQKAPRTEGEQRVQRQERAVANILQEVFVEAKKAIGKHAPMHSPHEGHAVIREEFDELWDEVKAGRGRQASAREEAIQLAAMAVRYVLDLDPR